MVPPLDQSIRKRQRLETVQKCGKVWKSAELCETT